MSVHNFVKDSLHVLGDVFSSNDELLDLASPLVNLEDLCISHKLLNRVVAVKSIASKNLNGISSILVGSVTSKELRTLFSPVILQRLYLGDGGEISVSNTGINLPGGLVSHQSSELRSRGHLSQKE